MPSAPHCLTIRWSPPSDLLFLHALEAWSPRPLSRPDLAALSAPPELLVAQAEACRHPVGYAALTLSGASPGYLTPSVALTFTRLLVAAPWRRRGVMTALLDACEAYPRHLTAGHFDGFSCACRVTVPETSTSLLSLFTGRGYAPDPSSPLEREAFGPSEDGVRLLKLLT